MRLLLIAACVGQLTAAVTVDGSRAVFTTNRMTVAVENGSVTRLVNRLTGTDFITGRTSAVDPEFQNGLVRAVPRISADKESATVVGPTSTEKGARVLKPELVAAGTLGTQPSAEKTASGIRYTFRSGDGADRFEIEYSLDSGSGDLLVTERATSAGRRVSGIRFALGPVACNGNLLLPAMAGIKAARANARYQYESAVWEWPTGWQLPFALFQSPGGGIWIHSEDQRNRFKSLRYKDEGKGNWRIALETGNHAPFDDQTTAESVTWHLNAYAGDWTIPVDEYKRWAYTAWRIAEKQRARPSWVDDIKLVIKHADYVPEDQIVSYLDEMVKHADPRHTLLFMTDWVDASKGIIMPYWVASARGEKFNREGRKRGFRTMFFANYIGITPNHPRFAEFKPLVIRNAFSQELEGWNLKHEWGTINDVQLYYVSPAAKSWRDLEIGQFRELLKKNPADGLFIDQAFLMFNDGNGLRDGQSTVDGNLAYHKELADALPGVAIGGESINEITMQYESFCEIHPLSLHFEEDPNTKKQEWRIDGDAIDRMVPIVPQFLLPHTRPIGYLGFPEVKSAFYEGWRDSLRVYRGIPTITKPSLEDLRNPDSECRRLFREAMGSSGR